MTTTVVTAMINSISNTIAATAPDENPFSSSVPEIGSRIDIKFLYTFLMLVTHNLMLSLLPYY